MSGGTKIEGTRERVASLERQLDAAEAAAEAATPGGLHGDPAVLSGIRRNGGHRQDSRRFAAYDRHAVLARELTQARGRLAILEAAEVRAARDAAAPCDIPSLAVGDYIRTRQGWWKVARVNAKSVSVETGYSWTDRVEHSKIIETSPADRAVEG